MKPVQRILVPVDFSAGSRQALRHAVDLAEQFGAEIEALHVWEPSPYVAPTQLVWVGGDTRTFWQHMSRELEKELRQMVDEVAGEEVHVETRVVAGYVSHAILQRLEAQPEIDLTVMATHGRTGLAHAFLGSVAERVVRHAPCPVLTMRIDEARIAEEEAREERRDDQVVRRPSAASRHAATRP